MAKTKKAEQDKTAQPAKAGKPEFQLHEPVDSVTFAEAFSRETWDHAPTKAYAERLLTNPEILKRYADKAAALLRGEYNRQRLLYSPISMTITYLGQFIKETMVNADVREGEIASLVVKWILMNVQTPEVK